MTRKATNLIIVFVMLIIIVGVGIGVYFYTQQGPVVGRITLGQKYYLSEIRPTELFEGATMDATSYFRINDDAKTGKLYLKNLTATTDPIPFIVTRYKESNKRTIIEFEYVLKSGTDGEDTKIQRLTAISTEDEIRIKAVESHSVRVIQQNPSKIESIDYEVTILVFKANQEGA